MKDILSTRLHLKLLFPIIFMICIGGCKDKPISKEQVVSQEMNENTTSTNETKKQSKKTILFFGDSLTAGYGLDEDDSFPSLIQNRIDSLNLPYQVVNAGLSGETSSGGVGRIDWVLQQPLDIFVLELGANDMLRGLDAKETKSNLDKIINRVKEKYPTAQIIMAGMQAAPNLGKEYGSIFNGAFSELAEQYDLGLIPFLLEGVAGDPTLNQADGKHPNAIGQKIVVENVWKILSGYIEVI